MSEYKIDYCHHDSVTTESRQEYIKREDAIKEAKAWSMYGEDDLLSRLGRLPSIDIVKCKDCKYYEPPNGMDKQNFTCKLLFDVEREETDFCSYGERKEREDD